MSFSTLFESSVISYGSQTQQRAEPAAKSLRVVLSHMVVKQLLSASGHVQRLRVVLSHMVVKLCLFLLSSSVGLRVVLSHMVVKHFEKII